VQQTQAVGTEIGQDTDAVGTVSVQKQGIFPGKRDLVLAVDQRNGYARPVLRRGPLALGSVTGLVEPSAHFLFLLQFPLPRGDVKVIDGIGSRERLIGE